MSWWNFRMSIRFALLWLIIILTDIHNKRKFPFKYYLNTTFTFGKKKTKRLSFTESFDVPIYLSPTDYICPKIQGLRIPFYCYYPHVSMLSTRQQVGYFCFRACLTAVLERHVLCAALRYSPTLFPPNPSTRLVELRHHQATYDW